MRHLKPDAPKPKPWDAVKRNVLARTVGKRGWDQRYVKVKKRTFLNMIKMLNKYDSRDYKMPIMVSAEGNLMHTMRKQVCKLKSCSKSFLTGHNNTKFHSPKCRNKYWSARTAAENRALRALGKKMKAEGRILDPRSEEVLEHLERVAIIVDANI